MKKAPEAFRTISEVSDLLETPAHVLRFWESKFYQIRPVKRAGGRRYYRPDDVALLAGIRLLLQDQGMTIRGVQKVLQEQGVRHVAGLMPGLDLVLQPQDADDPQHDEAAPLSAPEDKVIAPDDAATMPPEAESETESPATPPSADGDVPDADNPAPLGAPPPVGARTGEPAKLPRMPGDPDIPGLRPEPEPEPTLFKAEIEAGIEAGTEDPEPAEPAKVRVPEAPPADSPVEKSADAPARADEQPAPAVQHTSPAYGDVTANDAADFPVPNAPRLAQALRDLPPGSLASQRDRADLVARRLDSLLDRMSAASGVGRW
ncbi:MAG: MerR family transcriptional regulator [Pararhodobacter sp.]